MADGMGELHNIARNSALLGNICDFMFHLLLKIIILFCVLIFFIKAAYQYTVAGLLVVVHVPQFGKPWHRCSVSCNPTQKIMYC